MPTADGFSLHAAVRIEAHERKRLERLCSLGQITNALFEVGGQYRRNM
jgi:hypothetical protein